MSATTPVDVRLEGIQPILRVEDGIYLCRTSRIPTATCSGLGLKPADGKRARRSHHRGRNRLVCAGRGESWATVNRSLGAARRCVEIAASVR